MNFIGKVEWNIGEDIVMKYNIAIFGAFDVNSFGDSMFPKAIYNELNKYIELENMYIFSPYGCENAYNNNGYVYRYTEFEDVIKNEAIHAIIIGGGELFHNHAIEFENAKREKIVYEAGEIWRYPVELGKKYDIPVIFNSVGMPYSFSKEEIEEFKELAAEIKYISFRDRFSYQRFKKIGKFTDMVSLIPDSLWCIDDYFDKHQLTDCCRNLEKEYGFIGGKYIALQYGMSYGFDEVVDAVEQFASNEGVKVVVFPINACHEDFDLINQMKDINSDTICINRVLSPEEIITLISNAFMFVGTSLHGNLVANVYGVKNVIVDMYSEFVSKMDGFSDMIQTDINFVNDISEFWSVINLVAHTSVNNSGILRKLRESLHNHFKLIADVIENKNKYTVVFQEWKEEECKELFHKSYLEIWDSGELIYYAKNICTLKENGYHFEFKLDGIYTREFESIRVKIPVGFPAKLKINHINTEILQSNAIKEGIYIDETIILEVDRPIESLLIIDFEVEKYNLSDVLCASYEKYRNSKFHVQQLLFMERRYQRISMKDSETIGRLRETIKELTENAEHLRIMLADYEKKLQDLAEDNEKKLAIINHELSSKNEALSTLQKHYDTIIHSKMYRIMRFGCRGIDIALSGPRCVGDKVYSFWKIVKRVNIPKLKIAAGYVKNEGIAGAYRHLMRDYHQGDLKQLQVEAQPEFKEITSLNECEKINLPIWDHPTVSIVIPVYNQFTYTYNCIKSIVENSGDVTYEVILADDCSTDLTRDIKKVIENLCVVKTESNLRFLKNCNNAAKTACGEYVLFLNNDTQVQKDWLRPLVELCERDAEVGMVGSKLVYADGSLQEAGGIIWNDGSGWNYGRNDDAMKPEYCYVRETDYISGASIMIRRLLWEQLGGFDEYFAPAYCEDSDLAFQVRNAGYKVLYQPLSVVVHFEGKSNGTDLSSGVKKYQIENNIKLRKKWKEEFAKLYDNGQNVFKARERGQGKKTILVIDHYVPQFDKDAGSKTTYQYLKMFVDQGYLVKFMGDNFYQDEPYTTVLQQMGIEVLYGPWYAEHWKEWIKDNQRFIDFVYLNRPHITMKYIDFLKKETNIKCIYYGHDLHFLRLKREYDLTGNKEKLKESEEWMEKELYIMRKADISYYPSYIEEQAIHEIDASIAVKAITAYVYDQFRENLAEDFVKREGIMFVGGFGHPPNEDAVLWFVENVYPIISKRADIPFYIVGSKATDKIKKLHGGNIIVKGFVSEEELNRLYDTCKLVVVPLRYGAGVKGKVVEALYYGTPMVTTSVGAEGIEGVEEIIEIADEANDFAESVLRLYNDNERLKNVSCDYQKFIKNKFSINAVWDIIKEDFN